MRNAVLLLFAVILLYLLPAVILQATYGPSYDMMLQHENWEPDSSGGWQPIGVFRALDSLPPDPAPMAVSHQIPLWQQYLPILLPGLLLAVFLLTPLRRKIEFGATGSDNPTT